MALCDKELCRKTGMCSAKMSSVIIRNALTRANKEDPTGEDRNEQASRRLLLNVFRNAAQANCPNLENLYGD